MKPKSKAESKARTDGFEYRHVYMQGYGARKAARTFTKRASNKAMRTHNKTLAAESEVMHKSLNPGTHCDQSFDSEDSGW